MRSLSSNNTSIAAQKLIFEQYKRRLSYDFKVTYQSQSQSYIEGQFPFPPV